MYSQDMHWGILGLGYGGDCTGPKLYPEKELSMLLSVKMHSISDGSHMKIMPLEFKTWKQTNGRVDIFPWK